MKACKRPGCPYPTAGGKQRCVWHLMLEDWPIDDQIAHAKRRESAAAASGAEHRARVPKEEWPPGERWCSGCQGYVPLFYCTGSRCKAHASLSAHSSRLESIYGITREEYEALLKWQGHRCYICGRGFQGKRPAVDHDHQTQAVRGLLCSNNEYGCNLAIVGNLENAPVGGPAAAQNVVDYLADPPLERMRRGEHPLATFKQRAMVGVDQAPPPF